MSQSFELARGKIGQIQPEPLTQSQNNRKNTHTQSRPDGEEGLKDLNNNVAVFKTQSKTVTLMSLMQLFP